MNPHLARIALLSLACAVAAPGLAFAQEPPDADMLFKRGVEEMEAGNYEAGCKDIGESRRLKPLPGALFSLATCMDRWGRIATAVALYGEYMAVYDGLPDDRKARQGERPKVAKERREKLAPEVPQLVLSLPPNAPAGTQVKRDGQDVAFGVGVSVDPGEVVITTQAPGGPLSEQRIAIVRGEKKTVTVDIKPAPVVEPPVTVQPPPAVQLPPTVQPPPTGVQPLPSVPPEPDGMSGRRKAALAIGGLGIAGLAVGAVAGGLTIGEKGTIEHHCGEAIGAPSGQCDPTGLEAARRSKDSGLASTLGFAVGGAAVGVGLVLLLTERAPAPPKTSSAQRWIAVDLRAAGPGGAIVRAVGAF